MEYMERAPVAESQRIGLLDFLRGVAILGILTVNMFSFGLPELGYFVPYAWGENTPADAFAFSASIFLFQQKMYPLLAFLFGVGIFLLAQKEESGGRHSTWVYLRRMGVLVAIGLLHALLLWHGDILVWYSIAGMLAYLMRHLSTKLLLTLGIALTWGISIFCCSPAVGAMIVFREHSMPNLEAFQQHPASPVDAADRIGRPYWENFGYLSRNLMQTPEATAIEAHYFTNGTWLQVTPIRGLYYLNTLMTAFVGMIPMLTGIMLLGILAGRVGLLAGGASTGRIRWTLLLLGLLVGLPICAAALWVIWIKHQGALYGSITMNMIGGPLMAGFYIVVLTGIYGTALGRFLAHPIECVGRMALTNYISQTVVFVLLFQGWGLGWYGQLGYAGLSLLVIGTWAVQLCLSTLWLRVFRFGPVEWVWRSATYGRIQPLWRG